MPNSHVVNDNSSVSAWIRLYAQEEEESHGDDISVHKPFPNQMNIGISGVGARWHPESPGGVALQQVSIGGANPSATNIDAGVVGAMQEPETGHSPQ
jgi:hypothetical protein